MAALRRWAACAACIVFVAGAEAKGPIRCLAPADLAGAAQSFGTGPDNEKRAYAFFLERYGRPAAFSQASSVAEMTYGGGRATVRITLGRDPATGAVTIACRDGG